MILAGIGLSIWFLPFLLAQELVVVFRRDCLELRGRVAYIIYLERQSDGTIRQVKKEKDTFAGNIGKHYWGICIFKDSIDFGV